MMFKRNSSAGHAPRRVVANRRNAGRNPGMLPPLPPLVTRTYGAAKARRLRVPLATIQQVFSQIASNIQSNPESPVPEASPVLRRRHLVSKPPLDTFILRLDDPHQLPMSGVSESILPSSDPSAPANVVEGITDSIESPCSQHVLEEDEAVLVTLRHAKDRKHRSMGRLQSLPDDSAAQTQTLHSDVLDELFTLCKSGSPRICEETV